MGYERTKIQRDAISNELNELARQVVDAAFHVHKTLGPGLLESVYETCLCHELTKRGIPFQRQVALPVVYDGVEIEAGLRLDLWIDKKLVVELKAVEVLNEVYQAQLMTYMKLTGTRLGLLVNFNVPAIRQGIKRIIL
ncbi:MAG: GxxExxY protein [Mariprofundaceae bacterium]|nr:GxxExxY protein [Mariprofundaceae bacterium]